MISFIFFSTLKSLVFRAIGLMRLILLWKLHRLVLSTCARNAGLMVNCGLGWANGGTPAAPDTSKLIRYLSNSFLES